MALQGFPRMWLFFSLPLESWLFVILIMIYVGVDLFRFLSSLRLCASSMSICFLLQIQGVFSHNFIKLHLQHLSFLSGIPIMWILISLVLSHMSLNCSHFFCCCSDWVISIALSSIKLMPSSVLCSLLSFLPVFCFLFSHLQHMEVPRLGTESKPQLQPMPYLWQH